MSMSCPYVLLGLPYEATAHDVKQAYANALARIRASLGNGMPVEHLDAVRNAYRLLADAEQRRHYDAQRITTGNAPAKTIESPVATAATEQHALRFDGSGKVYFRIWITNLLLSLLTLGIYSSWAKVRREQYFHRHLRIDGANFDYHAKPLAILRGRIVFFLIVALYSLTRFLPAQFQLLPGLALALLFPWMIVRSLQFRAANTSYRGLRFSFRGHYREALSVYLGYGLLSLLTLGLAMPLMMWRQKKFTISHLGYGSNVFGFYASRRMFYRALWLPTLLIFAVLGGPLLGLIFFGKSFLFVLGALLVSKVLVPYLIVGFLILNLLVLPYARMSALNVAWSNTRLNDARMICRQRFVGYGATNLSNWLLMILSLGLFWPWAVVRMVNYRARHFAISASESFDQFIAGQTASASALGGEAAASLDMEIGL